MMALERSYSNEDEAELARSNFSARAKYGNQDLGVSQQGLLAQRISGPVVVTNFRIPSPFMMIAADCRPG